MMLFECFGRFFRRIFYLAIVLFLLASCAGERMHKQGLNQLAKGDIDQGLFSLEQATKENPDNIQFRVDWLARRSEQIAHLLAVADAERLASKFDSAEAIYRRVEKIEPGNNRVASGMELIVRDKRHKLFTTQAQEVFKKGNLEQALTLIKPVLAENPSNSEAILIKRQIEEAQAKDKMSEPILRTNQKKPVNLEFRDANVKIVFEALARSTGVNFIFDKDIRTDLRTTVFLRQATLEDAIDLILQTNRLEKKVLNQNTILIYPNTPEKLKDYQELVVKGFYLANADVKQTLAMIRGMLKTKDIFIDEKLNLLVMRDTPEAIRLAEKLIAMHDLVEPEVMLEVEVLEVKRSRLLELGVQWPNQLTLTPLSSSGSSSSTTTLTDLKNINSDRLQASVTSPVINLRREIGDVNILANPRIRARNREKAKIMIGDKVPVSTSTTTATGVISESVQYLDVGIKLDVEPNIYLQDEVAIKVGLEVSSIVNQVRTPGGSLAYQIGSRSVGTVLRLKDGETQVLAGLISDEERTGASRVPGLGDIPGVGRLFSSQKDDNQKTEIVLSITPRLVRNINRPESTSNEFWSGTESTLRTTPLTLQIANTSGNTIDGTKSDVNDSNNMASNQEKANAEPSMINLSWSGPSQVKVGEQFKLALKMKADGGVRSLPFQLGFDPAILQVIDVAEGPFFKQNEAKTSLSSNIDQSIGKVFVSVVRAGTDGAYGEGDVAVLTLKALAPKQAVETKLLSTTPISMGNKTPTPTLPAPFSINVVN